MTRHEVTLQATFKASTEEGKAEVEAVISALSEELESLPSLMVMDEEAEEEYEYAIDVVSVEQA